MIRVEKLDRDHYEVQWVHAGVWLPSRKLHRSAVPAGVMGALVFLRLFPVGEVVEGTGVRVTDHTWELEETCLRAMGEDV